MGLAPAFRVLLAFSLSSRSWEGAHVGEPRAPIASSEQTSALCRCVRRSCCKVIKAAEPSPPSFPPCVNLGEFPLKLHPEPEKGSWPRLDSRCAIPCPWVLGLRPRKLALQAESLEIIMVRPQFEFYPPSRTLL